MLTGFVLCCMLFVAYGASQVRGGKRLRGDRRGELASAPAPATFKCRSSHMRQQSARRPSSLRERSVSQQAEEAEEEEVEEVL